MQVARKTITLKAADMMDKLLSKVEENELKIDQMVTNPDISEATIRTQKHLIGKENKVLKLMAAIIRQSEKEDVSLTPMEVEWFEAAYTLTAARKKANVIVNAGDSLMELLQKYSSVKDIYGKIMKKAADSNLVMENGIFVAQK